MRRAWVGAAMCEWDNLRSQAEVGPHLPPPPPPPAQWPDPASLLETPQWLRFTREELREAMGTSRHKPDVAAELAALTGTVLHHHRPPQQQAAPRQLPPGPPRRAAAAAAAGRAARPQVPAAAALAALAAQRGEAAAAAAAAAEAPEPTVTTTRSSLGGRSRELCAGLGLARLSGLRISSRVPSRRVCYALAALPTPCKHASCCAAVH